MNIVYTPYFRRSYKKLVIKSEELKKKFKERMMLFEKNPQDPILKNHALSGKLKGYRAISIGYDLRAIFRHDDDTVIFFDIGTHDAIY